MKKQLRCAVGNLEILQAAIGDASISRETFGDGLCFVCLGLGELCAQLRALGIRCCGES